MERPIFRWVSMIAVACTLLAAVSGVWWYLEQNQLLDQQWFEDDQRWNAEILERLDRIEIDLGMMEADIVVAIDRHEEFVSTEHRGALGELTQGQAELGQTMTGLTFEVGVHQGEHQAIGRCGE